MSQVIPYIALKQNDYSVFCFKISAEEFLERGIVRRLSNKIEDVEAIQREVIPKHVQNMSFAMLDVHILWPEGIIISLKQEPEIKDGLMILPDNYWFYVDDGQHRYYALKTLVRTGKKLPNLEFIAIATYGLSVSERIRIFKLQANRRKIGRDFTLALSEKSGEFTSNAERRAYQVIMSLARGADSPLKGYISTDADFRARNAECWLSPSSLLSILKGMFGKGKRWEELSESEIVVALEVYSWELRRMWIREWSDETTYSLRINTAVTALIVCFTTRLATSEHLSSYTDLDEVRKFARLFSGFTWDKIVRSNQSWRQIRNDLEYYLVNVSCRNKV